MDVFDIVVEPNTRRRRIGQPLSEKRRIAELYRLWHGVREFGEDSERLGDEELELLFGMIRLALEEKLVELMPDGKLFRNADTSRPN